MADDDALRKLADRIQARAVRRCGELLKQHDGRGAHMKKGCAPLSRREVADKANISVDQQRTAARVANVPEDDFTEAVESENPPTVTALAEQGRKPRKPPPQSPHSPAQRQVASGGTLGESPGPGSRHSGPWAPSGRGSQAGQANPMRDSVGQLRSASHTACVSMSAFGPITSGLPPGADVADSPSVRGLVNLPGHTG